MIRIICGVTLASREQARNLQERIGIVDDIGIGVKKARLRWFGHIFRRDSDVGVKRALLFRVWVWVWGLTALQLKKAT